MIEYGHTMDLGTKAYTEDIPSWRQAINGTNKEGYVEHARNRSKLWRRKVHGDWFSELS